MSKVEVKVTKEEERKVIDSILANPEAVHKIHAELTPVCAHWAVEENRQPVIALLATMFKNACVEIMEAMNPKPDTKEVLLALDFVADEWVRLMVSEKGEVVSITKETKGGENGEAGIN